MFRVKKQAIPAAFQEKFKQIHHEYPTAFSHENFRETKLELRLTKHTTRSSFLD